MSRFRASSQRISGRRLLGGALAVASLWPAPASAFYQSTKLEGTIGSDIGGVWLSIENVMPEFRITYSRPKQGDPVPVEVGPIPPELEGVAGKKGAGIVIAACPDPVFCSTNNLVVGDILVRVGAHDLENVEDFRKAQENPPEMIMLSVRRPALKMSTASVFKIRYKAVGKEVAGASVAEESIDIRILDLVLPFADAIEKARQAHTTFQPSPSEVGALSKKWFELPTSQPPVIMSASHHLVARDNFDEALAGDKSLAEARAALTVEMEGNPLQGGGAKTIDVYGIETMDGKTISGNYVTVTIASAPFPINIEFKGRFRMTRLSEWSDRDDKLKASRDAATKPKEDLSKYKTLPDVPVSGKPGAKVAPQPAPKAN